MANSIFYQDGNIYLVSGSLSSSISTSIVTYVNSIEADISGTLVTQSHVVFPNITGSEFVASFQLDPNDPGSFYISGSNTSASLYMSSSGRLGFGTTNPESEFDIRTDDFKIRKRGKASGIRMNEDGNLESFNNDTNSATTGSELILKYTRGTSLSIPSGKRREDLRDEDFFKKAKTRTGDVLGSIRWVVDSGSLDHRRGGEAGNIKMQVSTATDEGITGKMSINVSADPNEPPQQLYSINGATQIHEFTGSVQMPNLLIAGEAQMTTLDIGGTNVTSTAAELNKLDGFTGDKDDLIYAKDLKATGVTATEFDYLDGVTSAIQTQLNAKTGISSGQASAIIANTAKTGTTSAERTRIAANHAKVGMTVTEGYAVAFTVLESRGVYSLRFDVTGGKISGTISSTVALR